MAYVDTSELDGAQRDLSALEANLTRAIYRSAENLVDDLVDDIEKQIKKQGLIDDDNRGNKPGQPPLVSSFFNTRSSYDSWKILSTAPHALAIDQGSSGAEAMLPDTSSRLAWEPENPSDYINKSDLDIFPGGTWYDPDTGFVVSTGPIDHPGNRKYQYILKAKYNWRKDAKDKIKDATEKAIISSGFSPTVSPIEKGDVITEM
jgi:hypothetical protein